MGIGSVTSMNGMSGMQMTMAGSTDSKSKSIQNEITGVQQQMQKLSSKEELSVNEKTNERKKLQKEISSLNTELKQHQEELQKSQRREIMMAQLQEDTTKEDAIDEKEKKSIDTDSDTGLSGKETSAPVPADTSAQQASQPGTIIANNKDGIVIFKGESNPDEKRGVDTEQNTVNGTKEKAVAEKEEKNIDTDTNAGISGKEMHAIVSADTSAQQANQQGTVIARIRGGIAILKGEIDQDKKLGADTEKKQAELEVLEKKEQRAATFQFSILGEANNTAKSAAKANVSGTKNSTQINTDNNAYINALKLSGKESQEAQQRFNIAFGN